MRLAIFFLFLFSMPSFVHAGELLDAINAIEFTPGEEVMLQLYHLIATALLSLWGIRKFIRVVNRC